MSVETKKMDNPILDALTIKESVSNRTNAALKKALEKQIKEEMKRIIKEDNDEEDEVIVDDEEVDTTEEPELPAADDEDVEIGDDEEEVILDDEENEELPVDDEEGLEGMEDFEVDDNTFDVRSDDEAAIKIFKSVTDSDQIVITRDGDKIELSDNETGADYLIDLGEVCDDVCDDTELPMAEANFKLEPIASAKKDIFKGGGPKVKVPANGKSSLGTNATPNKFGKIGDGKPFNESEEVITEEEEIIGEDGTKAGGTNATRMTLKPNGGKRLPKGFPHRGPGIEENTDKIAKLENKVKKITEENAILKETVKQLRECAQQFYVASKETALTNQKLGRAIKLFSEHSTTMDEKKSIIERFEGHKTQEEIQKLYETINKELKVRKPIIEQVDNAFNGVISEIKVKQPAVVNEDVQKMLSLMNRICS